MGKSQVRSFAHGGLDMTLHRLAVHGVSCSLHWCMHLISFIALCHRRYLRHVQGLAGM